MFARPVHPFLLALFPVLFLFSNNMDIVPGRAMVVPLIACLVMATLVFLSFRLITGNYKKAGLITSGFLLLFFLYGAVRDLVFSPDAESSVIINASMLAAWTVISRIIYDGNSQNTRQPGFIYQVHEHRSAFFADTHASKYRSELL